MKVLNKILGDGASKLLESAGGLLDGLTTSKEEKLEAKRKLRETQGPVKKDTDSAPAKGGGDPMMGEMLKKIAARNKKMQEAEASACSNDEKNENRCLA